MPFAFVLNAIAARILHFETKVFNLELLAAQSAGRRRGGVLDRQHDVLARLRAQHIDMSGFEVHRDLRLGIDRLHRVLDRGHAVVAAHARHLEFLAHRCSFMGVEATVSTLPRCQCQGR
jgi:hypothetical protein